MFTAIPAGNRRSSRVRATSGRSRRRTTLRITLALVLAATTLAATAPASDASGGWIRGWSATTANVGVRGVTVDLFSANADGTRGRFIRDTRTDGAGGYGFQVNDGCYVITMVAPADTRFTNDSRWYQEPVCVWNGQRQHNVDGILQSAPADEPAPDPDPNPACGQPIWDLVLEDHFSGNQLSDAWSPYHSAGNAGYGLRRPSAISVGNGRATITAQMQNGTLVSGGMSHRYHQTYGRYEFRVRTDKDPSAGTSGVVLTWPVSNAHPRDGENNVYETLATPADRHEFYTFIHEPFGTVHDQVYIVHSADASQWHTMEMEWMPDRMHIKRDGQIIRTIWENNDNLLPDVSHFLAIQLDGWKHQINQSVKMEIDYVKVWSYEGNVTC